MLNRPPAVRIVWGKKAEKLVNGIERDMQKKKDNGRRQE
jgi:hypothetical protein